VQPVPAAPGHKWYFFTFLRVFQAGSQSERMAIAINWERGTNIWARVSTCMLAFLSSQEEQAVLLL